ncbi:MAG TPA: FtsX-like permease family protein [Anaeromyxobacter sp.]|nr:FtsX-like permease family protein [Anaeromyxobacter sp.]
MLANDLLLAGRNLLRHTRRTVILASALAAVTALLVLLMSLTNGIERAMMESATTLMTGHVNVGGFYKVTSGSAVPLVADYQKVLADTRAEVPEVEYVVARGRGYTKVVSEAASMDLVLTGVDIEDEPKFPEVIVPLAGRLQDLQQPGTILVFQNQAERLKVKVGDTLTLSAPTSRGVNNTADVRVVVIARNIGVLSMFYGFIEQGTLWELYGLSPGSTGAIHLFLKDQDASSAVAARLRAKLAARWEVMDPDSDPYWKKMMFKVPAENWTGQKLDVTIWKDELGDFEPIMRGVRVLAAILITILMLVVIVGIINTLVIAIRERTREIGTLRAIGMQRTKVLWLFVLEMGLLGLLGTVGGAIIGGAVGLGLNALGIQVSDSMQMLLVQERLTFVLDFPQIVDYVLQLTGVVVLASLYPAFRAARLKPVTAMHHIG